MKRQIYRMLNRPGGRVVLSALASAILTTCYRRPCLVAHRDGLWLHWLPDWTRVEREIHITTLEHMDSLTRDYCCHGYTPRPGDTVIDVGAGTGWESMLFARLVGPEGLVIAIEAHPKCFEALGEMVERNKLYNVTPIWCAASDANGWATITDEANHQGNTLTAEGAGVRVPARSLDALTVERRLEQVDLLKMNIEGAEALAIGGMTEMIRRTRNVAIFCHDFIDGYRSGRAPHMRTTAAVSAFLQDHGFHTHQRSSDGREWVRDIVYGERG